MKKILAKVKYENFYWIFGSRGESKFMFDNNWKFRRIETTNDLMESNIKW